MSGWSRGYHRVSDDMVSSYGGHPTEADAITDATRCLESRDIDVAWVRDPDDNVTWMAAGAVVKTTP